MVSIVRQTLAMVVAFAGGVLSLVSGMVLVHAHGSLSRGDLRLAVYAGLAVQVGAAAYAFVYGRRPARAPARLPARHVPLEERKS